jgi:hypothetical protein
LPLVPAIGIWETDPMTARGEAQKRIDKKRAEIAECEGLIRDAKIYIQAMEDALRFLPREELDDERLPIPTTNLRPGSKVDKARSAIKSAGTPLHIVDLLAALGIKNTQDKRAALAGSLSAYARRGEIFTRPAPNTFGLIDDLASANGHGPPANFGIDDDPEAESQTEETIVENGVTDDEIPF